MVLGLLSRYAIQERDLIYGMMTEVAIGYYEGSADLGCERLLRGTLENVEYLRIYCLKPGRADRSKRVDDVVVARYGNFVVGL